MNTALRHAAAAIGLALVATACSGGTSDSLPEVISVEDGGPFDFAEVAPFESSSPVTGVPGDVVEQDCPELLAGTGSRCVWVVVPIDRDDPDVGTMGVSVAIRPGTGDQSLAPLAVLQGGPGGASSDLAQALPSRPYAQVLIDQRGVGFGSANFWCPEWQIPLAQILEGPRDRAESIASGAFAKCSERLKQDPAFVHTSTGAHAADVSDVMAALGYDRWFLYGVSYGTTIALEVMRDAPAGLAGVVLDGVYPASLDPDVNTAEGAERVMRELDGECRADPACSAILAGTTGVDGVTMSGLLADLVPRFNADPVRVPFSAEETTLLEPFDALVDGDIVAGVVFQLLYNDFTATLVPGVLAGLEEHDDDDAAADDGTVTAAQLVALVATETASQQAHRGTPATLAAVTCAERLPLASGPPAVAGPFAAAVVGKGLAAFCEPWAIEAAPLPVEPVESDLPVLLISGWFDPITPPGYAEKVAHHLPQATSIVSRSRGHGIWVWGYDSCVDRIVVDFLNEPSAELDTACASEDRALRWQALP